MTNKFLESKEADEFLFKLFITDPWDKLPDHLTDFQKAKIITAGMNHVAALNFKGPKPTT